MKSKVAERLTKEVTDSTRAFVKLWGESLPNYPQLRYEGKTVYVPHTLVDDIPQDLIEEWISRGLTIQTEIV